MAKGVAPAANRPAGTDNFEISLVQGFDGYASSIDPTIAAANLLVQGSQNVYKKTSGTIANRPGRKLYDVSTDSTLAKCNSGVVWRTSLGAEYPLRVANSKLQVESNITGTRVWYTLMTSLSQSRFVFDTWWDNTDKKDVLLFVAHDANTYAWSGGLALFVSYAGNIITLDRAAATAGFSSTGTVTINGVDYTYTGISGSTLTGTSDASAASANQVVVNKVKTSSNTPASGFTNDFIRVVGNQLYSGSYTSQLIYISKNTDYTDHTQSTPRLTGEGDTVILDGPGKGIGVQSDQAFIFAGTSILHPISFQQITVGTTLSEQTKRGKILLGNLAAAQAHEFIDTLSDDIVYLDQANQLRRYGTFRNIFTAKAVMLSRPVQDELAQETFTLGQLKVVSDRRGDTIYITAPNSGKVYLYREQSNLDTMGNVVNERLWQPPMTWNITRIDSIGGSMVGFSNSNPQIYYLWETNQWHDDSPSGQLPYVSTALFAYQNGGRRQGKIVFEKFYTEGYATQGSDLYLGLYYDYQGSTTLLSPIINDATSRFTSLQLFTGVIPPSLGDVSLGDVPLGDGLNILADDQSLVPKFRTISDVQAYDCFEFAPMFYSNTADSRWEILAFGTNLRLSQDSAVEIRN